MFPLTRGTEDKCLGDAGQGSASQLLRPASGPPPDFVNNVLLKTAKEPGREARPCHPHSSFPQGIVEEDASAPLHSSHKPAEPRAPLPRTSSFLSSDSRALRSSSFRMIALSSAILSWKRRASFSSNCCS